MSLWRQGHSLNRPPEGTQFSMSQNQDFDGVSVIVTFRSYFQRVMMGILKAGSFSDLVELINVPLCAGHKRGVQLGRTVVSVYIRMCALIICIHTVYVLYYYRYDIYDIYVDSL